MRNKTKIPTLTMTTIDVDVLKAQWEARRIWAEKGLYSREGLSASMRVNFALQRLHALLASANDAIFDAPPTEC
jgi:hypothetical protein